MYFKRRKRSFCSLGMYVPQLRILVKILDAVTGKVVIEGKFGVSPEGIVGRVYCRCAHVADVCDYAFGFLQ